MSQLLFESSSFNLALHITTECHRPRKEMVNVLERQRIGFNSCHTLEELLFEYIEAYKEVLNACKIWEDEEDFESLHDALLQMAHARRSHILRAMTN